MGVWIDRVSNHYDSIFSPTKVRVVGKRAAGAVPDFPLHADGHTDRSFYIHALVGAAMLDAAGAYDLHGLVALRATAQPTDSRGAIFSALKASGFRVDWAARTVTLSDVDMAVMRSDDLDILSVWQRVGTVVVVASDAQIDPQLDPLLDQSWFVPSPTDPSIVANVWHAVTGASRPSSDFVGVDKLVVNDLLACLKWNVSDDLAWRRLRAPLDRDKGGDDGLPPLRVEDNLRKALAINPKAELLALVAEDR